MDNYLTTIQLLGLRDQNLPVFKEARYKRLASVEKMNKLMNVMPRLCPTVPKQLLTLDPNDPEWDDKMIYPVVNHAKHAYRLGYWAVFSAFYAYNWNVIHGNKRLRLFAYAFPAISFAMLGHTYIDYASEVRKVTLFEEYCSARANELVEQHKFLLDHDHFRRYVFFNEDLKSTLQMVHRQANNHDASDFKDSELVLQDFIRRHSDPSRPDQAMFNANGSVKLLN